jgi:hypothetical protein
VILQRRNHPAPTVRSRFQFVRRNDFQDDVLDTANPQVPSKRSTRRTCPWNSRGKEVPMSRIASRMIFRSTVEPTGGQSIVRIKAPCSLRSRLIPSFCRDNPPSSLQRNLTGVCKGNRKLFLGIRSGFKFSPQWVRRYSKGLGRNRAREGTYSRRNPLLLQFIGTCVPIALVVLGKRAPAPRQILVLAYLISRF